MWTATSSATTPVYRATRHEIRFSQEHAEGDILRCRSTHVARTAGRTSEPRSFRPNGAPIDQVRWTRCRCGAGIDTPTAYERSTRGTERHDWRARSAAVPDRSTCRLMTHRVHRLHVLDRTAALLRSWILLVRVD